MALDVQRISLDISKQPTPQQVRLGQGDANATTLIVDVFDEGIAYDLSGYSVRLSMRLPNDGGYYDVDGTHDGNVATFDVDESYAASTSGVNGFGYVDVMDGDTVICSTSRFQLVVLQNASDGVELAPQYSDAVQDAIDRANAAAEAAEGVVLQDVPLMSATVRGGAQLGSGLAISDGKLSVDSSAIVLPTMSASTKGAAKLGSGLSVSSDALSVDASAVAIGALPVSHGGTGSTSAADARTALGVTPSNIGAAPAVHEHGAADITSGVLPIAHGGTGAATTQAARESLNVVACQDQANMGAYVGKLDAANQIWDLVSKCINSNNPTRDGHTIGLLMLNDGIGCYDWNGSGTIWKLGAVATTTTTVSDIITPASGITITSAVYSERNGVATLTIGAKGFSATGNITVGTIASGKRPTMTVYGCVTSSICPYSSLTSSGSLAMYWSSAASSSSTYLTTITYLLA